MKIVVALLLGFACSAAAAQQKRYSLKFNHVLGPKEPYHEGSSSSSPGSSSAVPNLVFGTP